MTDDGGRSRKEENGMRDEARGVEGDEKQEELRQQQHVRAAGQLNGTCPLRTQVGVADVDAAAAANASNSRTRRD